MVNEQLILEAESVFEDLPAEYEREYEKQIARYAERSDDPEHIAALQEMADGKSEFDFEAFFCLSIIFRRKKDFVLLKKLIDDHRQYRRRLNFNHIYVGYLVHSETFFDYDELLVMAYKDVTAFPKNSGFLQAFCNAFVTIAEQCDDESRESIMNDWYDLALDSINNAIEQDPEYAKFYCTKGRILALKERFAEAIQLINMAIGLEKSSRSDYALVLQTYENFKTRIMLHRISTKYESKLNEMQRQIDLLKMQCGNVSEVGAKIRESIPVEVSAEVVSEKVAKGAFAFVSYAHSDSNEVVKIINALGKSKLNIWYDAYIAYGSEWPEEIGNHIVDSSIVVVMLSTNSMCSANVRREVNMALSQQKQLLIVRLDEVNLSPGMQLQFGIYQMIDRSGCPEEGFVQLLNNEIEKWLLS